MSAKGVAINDCGTILYERTWKTGEMPEDWRKDKITPVFKKGRKKDPGNYRPLSLT